MFGYYTEKSTGHILGYWDLVDQPSDTDEYQFFQCAEEEKPEIWSGLTQVYSAETLLDYCFTELLASEPIVSLDAAVKALVVSYTIRFADHADDEGAALFRSVATDLGLSEMAELVIAKAIDLNAKITPVT